MKRLSPTELVVLVGHVEGFFAAIENGADAVALKIGKTRDLNYRGDFTLAELSSLVLFAHKRRVRVYSVLEGVISTNQIPATLDLLQALDSLKVDALTLDDPGLFRIVKDHFPKLKIHSGSLLAVHNLIGVESLTQQGAQRVTLGKELTYQEIKEIVTKTDTEMAIFIHGSLCFSYPSLCLASSFKKGYGPLQGLCSEPCRYLFQQGRRKGYFLSCNSFCSFERLPDLLELGLAAFNVEVKREEASYIEKIIRAYSYIMSTPEKDRHGAVQEVQSWLLDAPSRSICGGFFSPHPEQDIITPHRSPNPNGLWVATVRALRKRGVLVHLRRTLRKGDRLQGEYSGGKRSFVVKRMWLANGSELDESSPGSMVIIPKVPFLKVGERLLKPGRDDHSTYWERINREIPSRRFFKDRFYEFDNIEHKWAKAAINWKRVQEMLIIKIARYEDLASAFQSPADQVILRATRANLERLCNVRLHPAQRERFAWSLPPIILEKDVSYYRGAVEWYLERGFLLWEINNWGHLSLFSINGQSQLIAGYHLNLKSAAALNHLAKLGIQRAVLSLEVSLEELRFLSRAHLAVIPILTVYAWPPLFVSRLHPELRRGEPFVSERGDVYYYQREESCSYIYGDRPVNWLAYLGRFRALGYRHFMLDLSEGPHNQASELRRLVSGFKRSRADHPYALFNLKESS